MRQKKLSKNYMNENLGADLNTLIHKSLLVYENYVVYYENINTLIKTGFKILAQPLSA